MEQMKSNRFNMKLVLVKALNLKQEDCLKANSIERSLLYWLRAVVKYQQYIKYYYQIYYLHLKQPYSEKGDHTNTRVTIQKQSINHLKTPVRLFPYNLYAVIVHCISIQGEHAFSLFITFRFRKTMLFPITWCSFKHQKEVSFELIQYISIKGDHDFAFKQGDHVNSRNKSAFSLFIAVIRSI